jgi:hypothetical protein
MSVVGQHLISVAALDAESSVGISSTRVIFYGNDRFPAKCPYFFSSYTVIDFIGFYRFYSGGSNFCINSLLLQVLNSTREQQIFCDQFRKKFLLGCIR